MDGVVLESRNRGRRKLYRLAISAEIPKLWFLTYQAVRKYTLNQYYPSQLWPLLYLWNVSR